MNRDGCDGRLNKALVQPGDVEKGIEHLFEAALGGFELLDKPTGISTGDAARQCSREQGHRVQRLPQIVACRRQEAGFAQMRCLCGFSCGCKLRILSG